MSTTVSTLLQITSTTQVDKTSATRGNAAADDFQSHLQSATESKQSDSASETRSNAPPQDDSFVSSETSQDGETDRELAEADGSTNTSAGDENPQGEELESDSSDELDLSEAIVSYLTYSGEDESSAIIEVSQEIGVVVTEADSTTEGLLELQASQAATPDQSGVESGTLDEATTDAGRVSQLQDSLNTSSDVQLQENVEAGDLQTPGLEIASNLESASTANAAATAANEVSSNLKKVGDASTQRTAQSVDSLVTDQTPETAETELADDSEADQSQAELNQDRSAATESLKSIEAAAEEYFAATESNGDSRENRNSEPQVGKIEVAATNSQERATNESGSPNTSSAAENEPVPTGDRVRFVQRVSRAFQSARPGTNEIQLKLSPPELGTMRLSITVEQGVVSAKVETETAAARNVLLDNLPALRERLAEQEIRVEKFDVDVGRDGQQSDPQSQFGSKDRQADGSTPRDGSTANSSESEDGSSTTETEREPKQVVTESNLDVSI